MSPTIAVLFLASLLLISVLTWRDPLFKSKEVSDERLMGTFGWPILSIGGGLLRVKYGTDIDYENFALGVTCFYATIILVTLGRPALVMSGFLADQEKFPEATKRMIVKGYIALGAGLLVATAVLSFTGDL